jgi:hypothetical protein
MFKTFFMYLVWPNPGNASYGNPKIQALLVLSFGLILLSFILRLWRRRAQNPVAKRLSRSWPTAAFWFGFVALILTVSRVENVSFLSMRLLWVFWALGLALFLYVQIRSFRVRYYQPLPHEHTEDPREKYLPRRKR